MADWRSSIRGDGLLWILFKGNPSDAVKCIWDGFQLRNSRDIVPFYIDGVDRYLEGGPNAIGGADYLFRMDIKTMLDVGYEIWLSGVDPKAGEIYPRGLRIVQVACFDLFAVKLEHLSPVGELQKGQNEPV